MDGARNKSGRQKIDRIPDARSADDPVRHGEERHGTTSSHASLDAGSHRVNLQGQPRALALRRDVYMGDAPTDGRRRKDDTGTNRLVCFFRQHVPEPSHGGQGGEPCTQDRHGFARHKAREDQGDAERENDGPRSWRWNLNRAGVVLHRLLVQRPATYTTRNTTTHTTSTKCQYSEKTSHRDAWIGLT